MAAVEMSRATYYQTWKSASAIKFSIWLQSSIPTQPTNQSNSSCHMATTASSFTHDHFQSSFQNWLKQQYLDLEELLNVTPTANDEKLKLLGNKSIKHFEEYYKRRAVMCQHNAPSFLSPPWCSSYENSFLWIGGFRPSLAVRLIYSVCGAELEDQLKAKWGEEQQQKGNLADISADQLSLINALHCKTIKEEEALSSWMASLQEDIADEPLALLAKRACEIRLSLNQNQEQVARAMSAHSLSLARILIDADRLRLRTLKLLMDILTPLQGVDFLIAANKLHLSMHEWGKQRDELLLGKTHPSS